MLGIAAMNGGYSLALAVLLEVPEDYRWDVDDPTATLRVILEAARLRPPVNHLNVILQEMRSFIVDGREVFFPKGTAVAASLCLASQDPEVFPEPDVFTPDRPNGLSSSVLFASTGFVPGDDGLRRSCPGRNIGVTMAKTLLKAMRALK